MKITKLEYQKKDPTIDVFIDESGIGRGIGYSVYCLVASPEGKKILIDEQVGQIEKNLKIVPFHWREQSWAIKIKFIEAILKIPNWSCNICIVENKSHAFEAPKDVISKSLFGANIKTLYIDGKKTKKYSQSMKKSLEELGINISSLKMVKSSSTGSLRIADAIAGLMRRSLEADIDEETKLLFKRVNKKITTQVVSGHLPNPPHGR